MQYHGDIYRPPSEADSLIIQITYGCSHNACTFCDMYANKPFGVRKIEAVLEDIKGYPYGKHVDKVFLADGNGLCLNTSHLTTILKAANTAFPNLKRTAIYATAKDIIGKSVEDLKLLKELGLTLVYIGVESGSDIVLKQVNKNSLSKDIIQAGQKLQRAGIDISAIIISGLGGKAHYKEHALHSAKVINAIKPKFLALMTLMNRPNTPLNKQIEQGSFTLLTPAEVVEETLYFIEHLQLHNTLFRANHISNFINLQGVLNRDKEALLLQLKNLSVDTVNKLAEKKYRSY